MQIWLDVMIYSESELHHFWEVTAVYFHFILSHSDSLTIVKDHFWDVTLKGPCKLVLGKMVILFNWYTSKALFPFSWLCYLEQISSLYLNSLNHAYIHLYHFIILWKNLKQFYKIRHFMKCSENNFQMKVFKLTHCTSLVVVCKCSWGLAFPGYSEEGRSLL